MESSTRNSDLGQWLLDHLSAVVTEDLLGSGSLKEISLIPPIDTPLHDEMTHLAGLLPAGGIFTLAEDGEDKFLGVPMWSIQYILPILSRKLLDVRKAITSMVVSKSRSEEEEVCSQVLKVTRLILCITADHGMALNLRKEALLILNTKASTKDWIDHELRASYAFLSRKPGSSTQWRHRLWLIELEQQYILHDTNFIIELLERENSVITMCAARKLRNYYAWSYRAQLRALFTPNASWDARDRDLVIHFINNGHGADRTAAYYLRVLDGTNRWNVNLATSNISIHIDS